MADSKPQFPKPIAFFWLLRLNRTAMVAMITGAAAFTAGAGVVRILWMTLAAWCLVVVGFSLDFYADHHLDITGLRAKIHHNRLANGFLSPLVGLAFSSSFITASFVVALLVTPQALLP